MIHTHSGVVAGDVGQRGVCVSGGCALSAVCACVCRMDICKREDGKGKKDTLVVKKRKRKRNENKEKLIHRFYLPLVISTSCSPGGIVFFAFHPR